MLPIVSPAYRTAIYQILLPRHEIGDKKVFMHVLVATTRRFCVNVCVRVNLWPNDKFSSYKVQVRTMRGIWGHSAVARGNSLAAVKNTTR